MRLSEKKQREAVDEGRWRILNNIEQGLIHLRNAILEGDKDSIDFRLFELALNTQRGLNRFYLIDQYCRYEIEKPKKGTGGSLTREDGEWQATWDNKMHERIKEMWRIGDDIRS
jgi:hypothetical protein